MNKLLIAGLVSLGLAGCVTSIKPIEEAEYVKVAKLWNGVQECVINKYISSDLAAVLLHRIEQGAKTNNGSIKHFYEVAALPENKADPVNEAECIKVGIFLAKVKQENNIQLRNNETNNRPVVVSPTVPRTVNTYCNRIGTQTLCNSY